MRLFVSVFIYKCVFRVDFGLDFVLGFYLLVVLWEELGFGSSGGVFAGDFC